MNKIRLYLYYGLSRLCHRLLLQLSQAFHTYLIELYGIVRSVKACFAFSKLISKFSVFQPTNNNLEHLHPWKKTVTEKMVTAFDKIGNFNLDLT